jgi:hypothetical protein
MTDEAMSPLRRRMIEDMTIRKLSPKTQQGYIRTCTHSRSSVAIADAHARLGQVQLEAADIFGPRRVG